MSIFTKPHKNFSIFEATLSNCSYIYLKQGCHIVLFRIQKNLFYFFIFFSAYIFLSLLGAQFLKALYFFY
jgi:hypothetical protein